MDGKELMIGFEPWENSMAFKDDEERKAYFREYNKGWYRRHKERLLEKRRQHNEELRQWIRQYKSKLRCVQCGENHPACLQFTLEIKWRKALVLEALSEELIHQFKG
jgi:hypothetical protein